MLKNNFIEYDGHVLKALEGKKPTVAVETGFLYYRDGFSDNIENALNCVRTIRDNGAVPAVCGIQNGKLVIGMNDKRLVEFLKRDGLMKCNTRDIAAAVTQGITGTTTVSAAMFAAAAAGIPIVAAGGIGGVHRNAGATFDISTDLTQLGNTPVTVVCSGAKSILDIKLTLEYLETHGVAIVGYGTKDFPAYYVQKSGYKIDFAMDSPLQIASLIRTKSALNDKSGLLVANPIAKEFELDQESIDNALHAALKDAEKDCVGGKEITAYLLNRIGRGTEGRASSASRAIQMDNAKLAARIAVDLCGLDGNGGVAAR